MPAAVERFVGHQLGDQAVEHLEHVVRAPFGGLEAQVDHPLEAAQRGTRLELLDDELPRGAFTVLPPDDLGQRQHRRDRLRAIELRLQVVAVLAFASGRGVADAQPLQDLR